MKITLPILFLIIFFGCKSIGGKNINQETEYGRESEAELYPIDSTLFAAPCTRESLTPITYRGDIRYGVKDVDASENKLKEILAGVYSLEPDTRNESFTNGIWYKSYQYTIPTENFLAAERKLDSLFGRAESKYVNKTTVNYDFVVENLVEEQKRYKIYVAKYNNVHIPFQEKKDLLTMIENSTKNIKSLQYSSRSTCKNMSALTIQFSGRL